MDEIGTILREAREAKGFSLNEAQEKTRIGAKFLEALENGHYEQLPTPVHAKGFLRNYARFLGLDPQSLLERYEHHQGQRPAPSLIRSNGHGGNSSLSSLPPVPKQTFFNPVNLGLSGDEGGRSHESTLRLVIIAALIIALALVANRFLPIILGNGNGTAALTTDLTEAVNQIINNPEPTATPTTAIASPADSEAIVSTSRTNTTETTTADVQPTPTSTRPALPAVMETVRLRAEISERTWLRVTIDGEVVFEGMATPGDGPLEWEAQNEARLLTGNAIGVFVTINDVPLGKLGGRAEVVEELWTTTQ